MLDGDGVFNDGENALFARLVHEMLEHEAGEVAVKTLVTGDQFVTEGQTWEEIEREMMKQFRKRNDEAIQKEEDKLFKERVAKLCPLGRDDRICLKIERED